MNTFNQLDISDESTEEDDEIDIARLYKTPGHPTAFAAPGSIYKYFKKKIPLSKIKQSLEEVDSYTLHREYKKPKKSNPYFAYERRKHFQADLISIDGLARDNSGINNLLLIIDVFSRKIWVIPLRGKSAEVTRRALKTWLDLLANDSAEQKIFLSDRGGEFKANIVKNLFRDYNVKQDFTQNINKAAIAERANKTLQILIYKYLTDQGETKYINVLPQLVQSYNNRVHRTISPYSPNQADNEENESKIRAIHLHKLGNFFLTKYGKLRKRKRKPKFSLGDMVRIKTYAIRPSAIARAYRQQFGGELFTIVRIRDRMPILMYDIKSMDTGEEIEGSFYAEELQRVRGDAFKIEEILDRRGTGRNEEVLVKWKYFGPQWNEWIRARDIIQNAL